MDSITMEVGSTTGFFQVVWCRNPPLTAFEAYSFDIWMTSVEHISTVTHIETSSFFFHILKPPVKRAPPNTHIFRHRTPPQCGDPCAVATEEKLTEVYACALGVAIFLVHFGGKTQALNPLVGWLYFGEGKSQCFLSQSVSLWASG